jgi:thiol-disulfide isomerase/thioredoxin
MKKKLLLYAKEILTFIVVLTILSNVVSLYKSSDLSKDTLSIKTLELINNKQFNLKTNKPILIHFWATWCPTCKLESNNIQILSEHFEVLSIAVKSGSKNDLKIYMKEHKLNYRVYNDENAQLASKFNISVYPTTFIYNSEKKLVFSEVGYTSTFGLWLRMWWAS